jgi:hypothetical protein
VFESATIALYAKKTMLEHSALKVTTEFIVDKSRKRNAGIRKMGLE